MYVNYNRFENFTLSINKSFFHFIIIFAKLHGITSPNQGILEISSKRNKTSSSGALPLVRFTSISKSNKS